jgi:tetratricopeptide (TPR) repeat protein
LVQAGAYIGATGLTVEEYIAHYDKTWAELMSNQNRYPLQEYADRSVLTTWRMSYEQVRMVKPEAAGLLDQWAFFHPGDMAYELIGDYPRTFEDSEGARECELIATDKLSFQDSVGVLAQYSLVNKTEGMSSFSIHAVVHEWSLYNIVDDRAREQLCVRAIRMVAKSIPSSKGAGDLQAARKLLPHARMAATRYVKMREVANLELELHQVAYFMSDWESSQEVVSLYLRVLRGKEEALGAKHTSILDTVHNLGSLYAKQGKIKEAEEMYLRALRGYEEAWGAKHTSTLDTVNNLGNLYKNQGKMKEAEEMYLRALRGYEEAWGAKHTSTLKTVNNLGLLYADQGKMKEAEEMYLRALRGYEEAWGAKHTSTLDTVHNLGALYWKQGKMKEAEEMYLRALRGYEEAWGAEHTSTLDTVNNLGNLYRDQGEVAKAKVMYERAAEGYEDVEVDREAQIVYIREQLSLLVATDGGAERGCQPIGQQPFISRAGIPVRAGSAPASDSANARSSAGEAPVRHRKRDFFSRVLKR